MPCNIDIEQHPYLRELGLSKRTLEHFKRFTTLEFDAKGILNIIFTYTDPISLRKGHQLQVNSEFENVLHYEGQIHGILYSENALPSIVNRALVFNDPLEALSYLEVHGLPQVFEAVTVLPRTFTRGHVETVRAYFPLARPVCCFGNGQLAALQDAQYYLMHTGKQDQIRMSYGLQGIRIENTEKKVRYYEDFSLRCLVRDFFSGRYSNGPTTKKPSLKQRTFKNVLCTKKQ